MIFKEKTVYLIGGGPSFDPQQRALLEGKESQMITVNNSFETFPDAAVCYGGDYTWWKHNHKKVKDHCTGQFWTGNRRAAEEFHLNHIRCDMNLTGLAKNWIIHGGNSGYQAMNLAIVWGAKKAILVGYDCMHGEHGERHHYADHPKEFGANGDGIASWKAHFQNAARALKKGNFNTRVINCSKRTALTFFEQGNLEDWI